MIFWEWADLSAGYLELIRYEGTLCLGKKTESPLALDA